MQIRAKDLVTVTAGSPLWRALTAEEIVDWHLSPEAKTKMSDGSPAQPPGGKVSSSNGSSRFRVIGVNRKSQVFGVTRNDCAVLIGSKGPTWFAYMTDIVKVDLSGQSPPPRAAQDDNGYSLLMGTIASDKAGVPLDHFVVDERGEQVCVPYTNEEIAELELKRRDREARRLKLAMEEFGEFNLVVRAKVLEISRKYGLADQWVGALQVKMQEGEGTEKK